MIKKREFKNSNGEFVVIEEKYDNNNAPLYCKQWNNNILVVDLYWEYNNDNKQILFKNNIDGYWKKSSYHYFKGFEIKNSWTNIKFKGISSWEKFYCKSEYILDGKFKMINRLVSNHVDSGWEEEIIDLFENDLFKKMD